MPLTYTSSTALSATTAQSSGMTRAAALSHASAHLNASLMTAQPHTSSAVHHHGAQDTVVYARSGHGAIVTEGGNKTQPMAPGDFALIPAWEEHQEVNNGDEEVVWAIVRTGREAVVVNLEGWGESLKEGEGEVKGNGQMVGP
ncbi:hypothetical protein MMC32_003519 [Xylographa parallela]|nr:hypothetical protein [Xylographa parallela]